MCLIFLSINHHPNYKLIVAGNRDEFYNRRTAAANFWEDHSEILGGRDLEAGGTWLAMTKKGKIGMVTNYRDPLNINPHAPSRGHLVSDFLLTEESPGEYLRAVSKKGKEYNGFNLITGEVDDLWYYSNYKEGIEKLLPGFYGLSNHLLESAWPKILRGKEMMKPVLSHATIDAETLFEILYDDQVAPDQSLPSTGLPLVRERALSSMFIKSEGYGSRCSTVITIDKSDNVFFAERVYDFTTFEYNTNTYRFSIDRNL
jgi:uncharacterized protein with NRDE domain